MMNEIVQVKFDYSLVSEEQASQLQTIYNRVLIRHMAKTYEDGKDLLEAQNIKGLSYDAFITWAASVFGWSRKTIDNKMNAALYWGDFTAPGAVEEHAVYLLSSKRVPETAREEAKQRAEDGEKITEEVARQIRDVHKAKEQAEEAERKAKEQAQSAQQQLFTVQSQAQTRITELTQRIASLQGEMQELTTPEVRIERVEVIPTATTQKLQTLQEQINRLTYERNNETKRADSFAQKYQEDMTEREEAKNHERVRQNWRSVVSQTHSTLMRLLAQWPTPVDTQSFEADDWAHVDHLKNTLRRVQEECNNLYSREDDMIIDATR